MREFEVKKSGHEWLVTHCSTGINAFIPSSETQPKAVLLGIADDYLYWIEAQERNVQVADHQMLASKDLMLDVDFSVEDASRLQFELATEACRDPQAFYGGDD